MLQRALLLTLVLLLPCAGAETVEQGLAAFQREDFAGARDIWLPLAEQGDARAAYYMSLLYGQGKGVSRNKALAMEFLAAAARGGHPGAQFNLGNHYNQGLWVEERPERAAHWWRLAGAQDMVRAQHNLASLYYLGRGVGQDMEQARHWYARAAENGSEASVLILEQIESERRAKQSLKPEKPVETSDLRGEPPATLSGERRASTRNEGTRVARKVEGPEFNALGHDWVNSRPPGHYTLQLIASESAEAIGKLLKRNRFKRQTVVYRFQAKGKTFYALGYGHFTSADEARQGTHELPESLRANSPWPRRFAVIQALIK
jgi:TPR repeat protein